MNKLTKKALMNILNQYSIGNYVSHSWFKEGVVQETIKLNTTTGIFVVKNYLNRNIHYVSCEISLLKRLQQHHFAAPQMIKSKKGDYCVVENKQIIIISTYLTGSHITPHEINTQQLLQLSGALAKFHHITYGFMPKYYRSRLTPDPEYICSLFQEVREKLNQYYIEKSLHIISARINTIRFPDNLPQGFIHADYQYRNMLFKKDKLMGVLDFDAAYYGYFVFDIANMLNSFALAWGMNLERAKLLLENYASDRPLSKTEQYALYDALRYRIMLEAVLFMQNQHIEHLGIKSGITQHLRFLLELENIGKKQFQQKMGF